MARPDLLRRAAAEGLGVFALVFAGCGAIITEAQHPGSLGNVGIALVFGLVVMAMIYATGHLSGAHLNPAVTVAFAATRHLPRAEAAATSARSSLAPWSRPSRSPPCGRAGQPISAPPCLRSATAAPWPTRP